MFLCEYIVKHFNTYFDMLGHKYAYIFMNLSVLSTGLRLIVIFIRFM